MVMFLSRKPLADTVSASFLLRNFFTDFSLPFYLSCPYNPHVVSTSCDSQEEIHTGKG